MVTCEDCGVVKRFLSRKDYQLWIERVGQLATSNVISENTGASKSSEAGKHKPKATKQDSSNPCSSKKEKKLSNERKEETANIHENTVNHKEQTLVQRKDVTSEETPNCVAEDRNSMQTVQSRQCETNGDVTAMVCEDVTACGDGNMASGRIKRNTDVDQLNDIPLQHPEEKSGINIETAVEAMDTENNIVLPNR